MKDGKIETIDDFAKVAELMFENSGLSAAVDRAVRADLARIVKAAAEGEPKPEDMTVPTPMPKADPAAGGGDVDATTGDGTDSWLLPRLAGKAALTTAGLGAAWEGGKMVMRAPKAIAQLGGRGVTSSAKGLWGFGGDVIKGMQGNPIVNAAGKDFTLGSRVGEGTKLMYQGARAIKPFTLGSETAAQTAGGVASGLGLGAAGIGAGWLGGRLGAMAGGYKAEDSDKLYGSLLAPGGGSKENQGMLENLVGGSRFGGAHGADTESYKGMNLRAMQQHRTERQAQTAGMKPDDYLFQHQSQVRAQKGMPALDRATWKPNLPSAPAAAPAAKPQSSASEPAPYKEPVETYNSEK